MRKSMILALLLGFFSCLLSVSAYSQLGETSFGDSGDDTSSENQERNMRPLLDRIAVVGPVIDIGQMSSLFFTPSEQSLLSEARLGLVTRTPTDYELSQAEKGEITPGPRELALGGIVYLSSGDWTIWLNGKRMTPKSLLPEVLDIQVRKKYVKIKWFDAYTNQIFPIKLRPNQRFNIDSRIFLPGTIAQEASN